MTQEPGAQRTIRERDDHGDPQRLVGLRVALLATDGVEQAELEEPSKALGTAGAKVTVITHKTQKPGWIQAFNHITPGDQIPADLAIENALPEEYDALLLPGGALNADMLRSVPAVVAFIKAMAQAGKPMAVICHAPWELINAGLAQGRALTSYHTIQMDLTNAGANWVDQQVVVDGNLVTSRQPSDIPAFNREMLRVFGRSRQGGEQYGLPPGVEPLPTQPGTMPPASDAPIVPPGEQPATQTTQP
ncbi:MAG TPA: type 1 glutamine amidotransferase domain-containing protein [Ktedonobacterales bacterium]